MTPDRYTAFGGRLASSRDALTTLYEDLCKLEPPHLDDYHARGVEEFYNSMSRVRANAQFVTVGYSSTLRLKAVIESTFAAVKLELQTEQDEQVVRVADYNQERWSWEERAAKARTRMVDSLFQFRQLEEIYQEAIGLIAAIEVIYWAASKWRSDISAQVDVLKFGEHVLHDV